MNAPTADASESRGTILVVEDDHDIRVSVRALLEDEGFIVLTVTDGRSALELLEHADPPCLIILDLMLPVMDGWHFAERVRTLPRLAVIPIIVMSAYQDPPPPPEAVGFVEKPLRVDDLLRLIDAHCG